jgi:hypothetical protein
MAFLCYKWGSTGVPWNLANWKWSECQLVQELLTAFPPGVDAETAVPQWLREEEPYSPYDKQKKDRFIRILCKVKGYPEYDEQKKVMNDIKVTADDVILVIKAVSGIDVRANPDE